MYVCVYVGEQCVYIYVYVSMHVWRYACMQGGRDGWTDGGIC